MKSELIEISDELFLQLGKMITERYGIRMTPDKKIMFQSRLQRRLRELDIHSFDEYEKKIINGHEESPEFDVMADYISTNKTEFYREKEHFQILSNQILPLLIEENAGCRPQPLNFWSAGCSSGQEAYTIGMTLEEFIRAKGVRFNYSILATDISGRMLKMAKEAVYPMSQSEEMALELKQRYFLKSKNLKDPKVRVVREIREKVRVAYLNLMDSSYSLNTKFDVIFLRNTLIYFSNEIQLKVLAEVLEYLKPGGYLFIGHSESLINVRLPIRSIAPSVYIKTNTENL